MPSRYTGVSNLLAPENCTMILIDHQPLQFAGVQNIDGTLLVSNVVGLAKTAKVFGVPTILTTVLEERGGYLLKDVQDVFPDQKPINRTTLNSWEDERVVNAVKKIGRKKLVIAALWTEICLAYARRLVRGVRMVAASSDCLPLARVDLHSGGSEWPPPHRLSLSAADHLEQRADRA